MRVTKMLLSSSTGLLLVGSLALASWASDLSKMPTPPPKPIQLVANLTPAFAAGASGWARFVGFPSDGTYTFEAQLLVLTKDFKQLGIDPSNGFNDEQVLLTVGKKAIGLTLVFSHEAINGIVFAGADKGVTKELVAKGDVANVTVNGAQAADGKF